jgi:molecular chaperone GrpE
MRPDEERQGPVIRDLRRIDPATGQVRASGSESGPQRGPAPAGGQPRPGRHSVSSPSGMTARPGAGSGKDRPGTHQPETDDASTDGPATSAGAASTAANATGAGAANGGTAGSRPAGATDASAAQAMTLLAERTADLQRLQAEYANYRKRVERDRLAVREQALANVLNMLLPVLDDIGRARDHGELTGGFKSVADSLEAIVVKLGLTAFGENGDPFDPTLHEALMHEYSADVTEPTAVKILQPGYRVGERIIRPARVAVAEPIEPGDQAAGDRTPADRTTGDRTTGAEAAGGPSAATGDATDDNEDADGAGPSSTGPNGAGAGGGTAGSK